MSDDIDLSRLRTLLAACDDLEANHGAMPLAPWHLDAAAWFRVDDTSGNAVAGFAQEEHADLFDALRAAVPAMLDRIEALEGVLRGDLHYFARHVDRTSHGRICRAHAEHIVSVLPPEVPSSSLGESGSGEGRDV